MTLFSPYILYKALEKLTTWLSSTFALNCYISAKADRRSFTSNLQDILFVATSLPNVL